MVFCGLFPTDADQFNDMREALGRLQLNDAALSYEPEVKIPPSSPCSSLPNSPLPTSLDSASFDQVCPALHSAGNNRVASPRKDP